MLKFERKLLRMADTASSAPATDDGFDTPVDKSEDVGGDADTPADPVEFETLANEPEEADDVVEPTVAKAEAATEVPAESKGATAPAATPPVTPAEAPPAAAPAVQPGSAPAVAATPASTEVPAVTPAVVPPAQEPVQEPAQPAATVITPEEATRRRKEWFDTSVNTLATNVFTMTDEDVHAFEEDPKAYLPKLAAAATIHAIEAAVQTILPHIPGIVNAVVISRKGSEAGEEKFFARWPDLKKKENYDTVLRIGNAYRQTNPGATPEQFIEEVGVQAMVAKRLPIPGVTASEVPSEVIATSQATRPAGRSAPTAPASTDPQNEFTKLLSELDDD